MVCLLNLAKLRRQRSLVMMWCHLDLAKLIRRTVGGEDVVSSRFDKIYKDNVR
jgi:hypothetical protein